jgi:histidinol dehydrogenase
MNTAMNAPAIKLIDAKNIPETFYSVRRLTDGLDVVPPILEAVRTDGDRAIRTFASRFDRANPASFEIPPADLAAAERKLKADDPGLYQALVLSRDLALKFAALQKESFNDFEVELSPGLFTGQKTIPVERAGVYVPAGRFPLFSSVIMGSTPAKAAGVGEVILCTPPSPHPTNPEIPHADECIMAVASLCGIDRVFAVGGAQAIAAMAYGTESVPRVNVIVGPGNKYVAAAKKLVYGDVGIDLVAGPTEVMIIADSSPNPAWVAADLLAQAEHDPDAQAVLVTTSRALAIAVQEEVGKLVVSLSPEAAARKSFAGNSCIIVADSLDQAGTIANRKAPEHLELALDAGSERDGLEATVRNYGSLFVGHRSAEVLGDYAAGLNHTLPTSGSAAFTGGLSVRHFLKTTTTLRTTEGSSTAADLSGWKASVFAAEKIALAEGLTGHALAARCRKEN